MKKIYIYLLLFLCIKGQNSNITYIIASGPRNSSYYRTGKYIAQQYNKYISQNSFYTIETDGSDENIKLLKDNYADFAIIQRNVLIRDIFSEIVGAMKTIEIITPLFEEKLNIYHFAPHEINIREIENYEINRKVKIGFTSNKGESYLIFKDAIKLLDINYSNVEEIFAPYDSLIKYLSSGKIDFLVSLSLPIKELEESQNIKKAYFSYEDAHLLSDRIPNLFISRTDSSKKGHYTIATWTFLVALDKKLSTIPNTDSLFYALLQEPPEEYKDIYNHILKSVNIFKENPHHKQKLLTDLPLNSALVDYINYREESWNFFIGWIIFIAILLSFGYFFIGRFIPQKEITSFIRKKRALIISIIILITIYLASMELLIYAEEVYYKELGEKSKLLNMTRTDLHSWMFVIMATGNSNNIFPLSLLGKFIVTFNALYAWLGAAFISVSQYLTYRIEQKRKEGIMPTKFKNHIVIFGWNGTTEKFILNIIEDSKEYLKKEVRIVCVVPDVKHVLDNYKEIRKIHEEHKIDLIEGDARENKILERANIIEADTIILLAEDHTKQSDERVLLRAMAISRYVRKYYEENKAKSITKELKENISKVANKLIDTKIKEIKQEKGKNPSKKIRKIKVITTSSGEKRYIIDKTHDHAYMIAEINFPEFKESLFDADVNEVIISGSYTKAVIKQAIFNHGISKVLDEIMQYNEYNEFYKIDLRKPENKHLVGKTFDELLVALRKVGVLLVGIHVIFTDDNGDIIIDKDTIKELLKTDENGLKRDIIVNPVEEIEINRKTDNDDQLIVLAYSAEQLRKAIKKVKF